MEPAITCQWELIDVGDKSMSAYVCVPRGHAGPLSAIVLLHEIYGLNGHIRSLAERLAEKRYVVVTPDIFHRQGDRFETSYDDKAAGLARQSKLKKTQFLRDFSLVLTALRGRNDVRGESIGTVGISMGARLAFLAATNEALQAAALFYPGGTDKGLLKRAAKLTGPVLAFFGGNDALVPATEVAAVKQALTESGRPHEVVVYPEASHGFFSEDRAEYQAPSAEDAWRRLESFLQANLRGAAG